MAQTIKAKIPAVNRLRSTPNVMATTDPSKLLRRSYLETAGGPVDFLLTAYSEYIKNLSRIIQGTYPSKNTTYRIKRISFNLPYINQDHKVIPLYPIECLQRSMNYSADLLLHMEQETNGNITEHEPFVIGKLPVMIKSELCNLRNSPELHGSLPGDPGGYYIMGGEGNGGEKVIKLQTRLLPNQDVIFYKTKMGLSNVMICQESNHSTKEVVIVIYEKTKKIAGHEAQTQIVNVITQSVNNNQTSDKSSPGVNVGYIYLALGVDPKTTILPRLRDYIPPELPDADNAYLVIRELLLKSLDAIPQDATMQDALDALAIKDKTASGLFNNGNKLSAREVVQNNLTADFFPQISPDDKLAKIDLLNYMLTRLLLAYKGFIPPDDRDSGHVIQVQTSPSMMTIIMAQVWRKVDELIRQDIANKDASNTAITLSSIKTIIIEKGGITDVLNTAIKQGKWGIKTGRSTWISIKEELPTLSIVAKISAMTNINTPSSKRGAQIGPRTLRADSTFLKCIAQTPDSEAVGLVTNLASLAKLSIDRPESEIIIIDQLNTLALDPDGIFSQSITNRNRHIIMINGRPIGWCNGPGLKAYILQLRRQGIIASDIGIALEGLALQIKTISGRLYAPVLIVGPPDANMAVGELMFDVIERQLGRSPDFDTLLHQGGVEYLESHELQSASIAETLDIFRQTQSEQRRIQQELRKIKNQQLIEQGKRKGDIEILQGETLLKEQMAIDGRNTDRLNVLANMNSIANDQLRDLVTNYRFTHVVLDPSAIFGVAAATTPRPDMMQAPRIGFQCNMAGQTISVQPLNVDNRLDGSFKRLANSGEAPMFYTQQGQDLGTDVYATGQHVVLAIMPWGGYNVEDSIIFNSSSLDLGLFSQILSHTIKVTEQTAQNSTTQRIFRPLAQDAKEAHKYRFLDRDGIVEPGSKIESGDCLVGMAQYPESMQGAMKVYFEKLDAIHALADNIKRLQTNPNDDDEVKALRQNLDKVKFNDTPGAVKLRLKRTQQAYEQTANLLKNTKVGDQAKLQAKLTKLKNELEAGQVEITQLTLERDTKITELKRQIAEHTSTKGTNATIRDLQLKYAELLADFNQLPQGQYLKNVSTYASWEETGIVDKVQISGAEGNKTMVKIKLYNMHKPKSGFGGGDKFAPRYAQKMTVSRTYNREDIPFATINYQVDTGKVDEAGNPIYDSRSYTLTPDAIINNTCIPSRMTVSLLLELLTGNYDAMNGTRTDASAYRYFNQNDLLKELVKLGFQLNGNAQMINPLTGEYMKGTIAIGQVHYQALKHQVEDKIRVRGLGLYDPVTHQPVKGRKRTGGIKFGEMERDAIIAWGASYSLKERFASDATISVFCRDCGISANYYPSGDQGFECKRCRGNNFGKVNIPAGFTYTMQLMGGIGIETRLLFDKQETGRYDFLTDNTRPSIESELPVENGTNLLNPERVDAQYMTNQLNYMFQKWSQLDFYDTVDHQTAREELEQDDDANYDDY